MSAPVAQMFEQALNALKGWFHLSALDKRAKLAASLLDGTTSVPAGRVAVLNDDGEFVLDRLGGEITSPNHTTAMPIFLWCGRYDNDVYNDGTSPVTDVVHWYGLNAGYMSGLVATGGYELQTTEFDPDQTYLPNALLTSSTRTVNGTTEYGHLTSATAVQYVNWICGICSTFEGGDSQAALYQTITAGDPVGVNAHGVSVLTFWSYFLPSAANESQE